MIVPDPVTAAPRVAPKPPPMVLGVVVSEELLDDVERIAIGCAVEGIDLLTWWRRARKALR